MSHTPLDLRGKFIIASPGMGDPRFEHSVVLICAHNSEGAMGVIINKPIAELGFAALLSQLGIEHDSNHPKIAVHFGGPVETGRGFVLHSLPPPDATPTPEDGTQDGETTIRIAPDLGLTTTRNILEDIAQGKGPDQAMLALGYSGWGAGQLEDEIKENGWLIADADHSLIFASDNNSKWQTALRALGIDPLLLSTTAGHA